jgi:hypothetical protein
MKIRTFLVFLLMPFAGLTQRAAEPLQTTLTKTTTFSSVKTDELTELYPGNWLNIDSVIIYTVTDNGGFVAGTNVYGDLAKAQRFTVDKPGNIVGVRYWIGVRDGEEGSLAFNIWSFNGSPGAVLASKVIPANQVEASLQLNNAFYVEFDEPVPVDGDFVVGVDLSDIGDTQIALVSSWDGQAAGLGHSWEKWSDGKWYTFLDPDGWDMDIDLAIFPVIRWNNDDPDPDPEAITGIQVVQRADGSGLVDVGYNLSGEHDEYFVDLALSLDGGNTFSPVNPADVSGDFWPVSPGENKQLVFDANRVSPGASTSQARVMLTARNGLIVTTSKVDHITFSTATMGGEVLADGGFEVTSRGIVFGTEPEPAISNPTAISLGAGLGPFSDYITELTPNTTYYVRAWATNTQETAYGNQEIFTTPEEGPIVIHGPDGSRFVLPVEYLDFGTTMSIEEHPFADILIPGQQAVSAALRINIGNGNYVDGENDYEIDIPIQVYDADPDRLRLIVRMNDGQLIQLPGDYDPEQRRFSLKTLGLAHDWVVGVAMGSEIRSASSQGKEGNTDDSTLQKDQTWPTLDVVLADVSQEEVRISRTVLNENVLPVARDVMITLQGGGFKAPNLRRSTTGQYRIIIDNNVSSYYSGPDLGLLGKVVIGYKHFATDVTDPSTWQFEDVCIHETYHGVQYSYGKLAGVAGNYMFGRVNGAYKEGTATLIGATYETRGSIGKGAVHVRIKTNNDGPHDLGTVVDDIDPSPYDRQDFFAFLAKRYFEGDLTYTHGMFKSINDLAATMSAAVHHDNTKKFVFRKGLNQFLISKEKTLPEAYTEYALQRLYLHEPQYLLRGSEDPAFDARFSKNRLAKHLLEKSSRHTDWKSSRNDTIHFNPIKFENLKSMASAAATLTVPTNVDPAFMPDTLSFSFALSGNASVNHMMREEGIRLLIIRAKDQHGTAVANNPMIYVENIDDPVKVPLTGGVTHLVFLAMNAYVEDITTTIDIGLTPEGTLVHNTTQNKWYDIIQNAVNEAADGDVIEVHPGTYYEKIRVLSKNITLRSARGAELTIIDGRTRPNNNAVDYTNCNGGEFSGFTIQNWKEGGISLYRSTLNITNNIIKDNHNLDENVNWASGIHAWDCHLVISGNVIKNNIKNDQSGAGIDIFMGSAIIQHNTITGNQIDGHGGGISVSEANATITDNTISENSARWGGGINIEDGTGTVVERNNIFNNVSIADGGGIVVWDGTPQIRNNNITGNQSGQTGGGIGVTNKGSSSYDAWPVIEGNTISNNHATQGGGVYGRASNWERTANIVVIDQLGNEVPMTVLRHMPCFTEPTNTYSGNTHEYSSAPPNFRGAWGPNGWCDDSGFHVKMW